MSELANQLSDDAKVQTDLTNRSESEAVRILVRGQVQGVGFRPYVYRLAQRFGLGGRVLNTINGVVIELEGMPENLAGFQECLINEAPEAAVIDDCTSVRTIPTGRSSFAIDASGPSTPPQVRVPRDLATCFACREEIFDPANRRLGYPFTNCTACGPRYSILLAMPYDRPGTSMHRFQMCAECEVEYHNPGDRRFHAQPNACAACGPQMALWDGQGRKIADSGTATAAAAELLRLGQIVALKGLGGFQLLVRADRSDAVCRLRRLKHRPSKPLAVMVPSLEFAKTIAALDPQECELLESPQNPIVLVQKQRSNPNFRSLEGFGSLTLAPEVAPRVGTIGVFLPTTPLHHLLLAEVGLPLVATSGNRSEEPIVTDEHDVVARLSGIADAFLVHDRPIIRGLDDAVVRVITGQPVPFRLARGLTPLPLPALKTLAQQKSCPPFLATGGHQKTALAVWTGKQAILAQHIGDMDNVDTRTLFQHVVQDLGGLYQFEPAVLACDQHPDYFTTQWAFSQNKPVTQVQHHHAHAVACMAEHDLLHREVLAFTWDGTGYGPDGTIWGGEVLQANSTGFGRVASLLPFPLPGGEQAIRNPNRAAFGLLWSMLGADPVLQDSSLHRLLGLLPQEMRLLTAMIRRGINTPWTTSMGRLFDAVAALVLGAHEVSYEGEAGVWLEAVADPAVDDAYSLPLGPPDGNEPMAGDRTIPRGDWRPMLSAILKDLAANVGRGVIAAQFHNALAQWAAAVASMQPLRDVVLSGGCFQNRLLTERTVAALVHGNTRVYVHAQIPPGDGGLAVGQLAVAMAHA
jgi:hydrogenase maturation protein HypF